MSQFIYDGPKGPAPTQALIDFLLAPKCDECGARIAPALARLGSLHCHDCRRPGSVNHGGFNA